MAGLSEPLIAPGTASLKAITPLIRLPLQQICRARAPRLLRTVANGSSEILRRLGVCWLTSFPVGISSRELVRRRDPTLIGTVQDVAGTSVSVSLVSETATGLSFFKGESYRIGQVGSFVRIPLGYTSLFGIVSQVGAGAAPKTEGDTHPWGNQWLKVQLVGERGREGKFERGVSQHPTINDAVHIVTEEDLREIYGPGDPVDFVTVGHLASAESIPALVNINKLVTRHSAVVGTTGAGKSTTVAGLLTALSEPARHPLARIVVLELHGEYATALA